jgi:hypothetical protein
MRRQIADLIFEIESVQCVPYQIEPVSELMNYLYGVRGFDNHETTAYNLSKAIESRDGVNEEAEVDRPTLLSCTFEDYALSEAPLRFGDTEVNLLNSRASMAMTNRSTRERRKLWRSWVRQLSSQVGTGCRVLSPIVTSPSSVNFFRVLLCMCVCVCVLLVIRFCSR